MNQGNRRSRNRTPKGSGGRGLIRALTVLFGAVAVALAGYLVWALATGGSGAGGGVGAPRVTPEVAGAPRLKVDRESQNLGDIKLGTTVRTAVELTNVGDQPLRITEKPSVEVVEGC